MNFASAATEHPAFARSFLVCLRSARVRFRPMGLAVISRESKCERTEREAENCETDEDEFHYKSPADTFAKSDEAY